jgi:putative nucleotidyltransferase with HDIG domain
MKMSKLAKFYIGAVIAAGITATFFEPWRDLQALRSAEWLALFFFICLGLFSERLSVQFRIGSGKAESSIAFISLFASTVLFARPAAVIVCLAIYAIAQIGIHNKPRNLAAFNVAQVCVSLRLATLVYAAFGGEPGITATMTVLNFAGMAAAFFFANQLLVSVAVVLMQGGRVAPTFVRVASVSGANLLYDLIVSPVAAVVVLLHIQLGLPGLFIVVLPLLLIRYSYSTIQKLQQANRDVLQVLVKTIETRDPYTSGHSLRVAQLAKAIAEDLELPPTRVDEIETAALVHDIGKIDTIYADIIGKHASLSEAEKKLIVTHAAKGAEFLKTLSSFDSQIILGVQHHHERWDGTGYPDRLAGTQIPLAARIIMLCDSVDAMLSDRPYRRALTVDQVRTELLRCSGSQFDPEMVHIVLQRNTLERAARLALPAKHSPPAISAVG